MSFLRSQDFVEVGFVKFVSRIDIFEDLKSITEKIEIGISLDELYTPRIANSVKCIFGMIGFDNICIWSHL